MFSKKLGAAILSLTFVLAACGQDEGDTSTTDTEQSKEESHTTTEDQSKEKNDSSYKEPFEGTIDHVHGVGYINGDSLALAAHDGLKFYEDGKWHRTTKQNNDYMGFNAVDNGFYTSGHPGEDSSLPNPIGIQKSEDLGQTLDEVAFEGEFDFHVMGVGYQNHAIYVLNGHGNDTLESGLHKSLDDGESFEKVEVSGIQGQVMDLAVHPTNEDTLAVATKEGIFLSRDGGETFEGVSEQTNGTSVYFSEDTLTYGSFGSEAHLTRYTLEDGSSEKVSIPDFEQDAVAYFTENPENPDEMMFLSFENHGFYTQDGGENWRKIVDAGQVKE
ncbi:F510_1955 family glycosylhydrolase [Pontibacillus salipaludis]|uniref:F510_1955 family glycosylhydrolase n=1 Tax=Pontibacillus salipaludis TaxID=1697394 RepID=UPI0031E9E468